MKKYSICFFAIYCLCFILLYMIYPEEENGGLSVEGITEARELTELAEAGAQVLDPKETGEPEPTGQDEINVKRPVEFTYWVYEYEGEILVCYPDHSSVFKRIPIVDEILSKEERNTLKNGLCFYHLEDVYHYLESITS